MNTQGTGTPPHRTATPAGAASNGTAPPLPGTASAGASGAAAGTPYPQGPGTRPPAGGAGTGKNGTAVAAMVLGIISLVTSIFFVGGPLGVIGLVLGVVALVKARRTGTGRGMSVTGVLASFLAIVVSVLVAVLLAWYADNTQKCYRPDSFQQYRQCVHEQLTGD
ncbi:DUF4190 domain-containing protein [Streptomyces sp. NPDC057697]|uniref:DUF4190 domain-containing protein n=1 Tax=Streptomyces sp. NPDC057697 TaxID=3346219 RepID=UPI0036AF8E76